MWQTGVAKGDVAAHTQHAALVCAKSRVSTLSSLRHEKLIEHKRVECRTQESLNGLVRSFDDGSASDIQ